MRVTNMQVICSNDARIMNHEFKNQGDFRDTYSALWYVRTLVLDPGRLSEHPGSDWDSFWLLKTPLVMISNSSFLPLFKLLFCLFLQPPTIIFVPFPSLCNVYCIRVRNLVQISPHQCSWIGFDSTITTFQIWPKSYLLVTNALDANLIHIIAVFKA